MRSTSNEGPREGSSLPKLGGDPAFVTRMHCHGEVFSYCPQFAIEMKIHPWETRQGTQNAEVFKDEGGWRSAPVPMAGRC